MSGFPLLMIRESIASVAMSHPETCTCLVCRADAGDRAALERLLAMTAHRRPPRA